MCGKEKGEDLFVCLKIVVGHLTGLTRDLLQISNLLLRVGIAGAAE